MDYCYDSLFDFRKYPTWPNDLYLGDKILDPFCAHVKDALSEKNEYLDSEDAYNHKVLLVQLYLRDWRLDLPERVGWSLQKWQQT